MAASRAKRTLAWAWAEDGSLLITTQPMTGVGVLALVAGMSFVIAPLRSPGLDAWFFCAVGVGLGLVVWAGRLLRTGRTWHFDPHRRELVVRSGPGPRARESRMGFDAVVAVETEARRHTRPSTGGAGAVLVHTVRLRLRDGDAFTIYQGSHAEVARRRDRLAALLL
ncbi:hypothetical protein [Coralloluteibacterium thermophilus]|uniref:DUF2244 domain-containing protein n=1 Tax=Coralloluteibacterium thermophilum TaxID=2707049 RepID=A0ABV9NHN6_9GAMM